MTKRTHRPAPNVAHPGEGELRAYLDGELPPFGAMRVVLHTRRCHACAHVVGELRALDARTTSLLADLQRAVPIVRRGS